MTMTMAGGVGGDPEPGTYICCISFVRFMFLFDFKFDSFHRTLSFAFQETETKSKETQGESLESLVVERDELLAVASLGDLKFILHI